MKIIKRNGAEAVFDIHKIVMAVTKANEAVEEPVRMTSLQIQRIAESVEISCQEMGRSPAVEEIQDLVEKAIMAHGAFEVAKQYITYRYTRSLLRQSNTTDDRILSLIECNNEEVKQENANKNPTVNAVQRDYMAGEVSKDITRRILLLDVTPLSLGIETMGGVFTRLIDRNTTIPTKKSQIFSTAADGQTSVEVHVLQGEREMAADNKTLGRFQLTGIAPAPRGVPQIEVSFDIDANGIVKVSAKDLGTGKEQNISITASTNLSKDDIDKAVKEAEQYAAEDKARKDAVDAHNNADAVIYQSEKALSDLGDKVSDSEKAPVQAAIEKLKEANKGNDVEAIKAATDECQKAFYAISEKLYKNAAPQDGGAQGGTQGNTGAQGGDDGVVDADYEEVKD